jgi:hypothetical protein
MHVTNTHSLPIPHVLAAFTMALPAVAGLTLQSLSVGQSRIKNRSNSTLKSSRWYNMAILILFIYETVVATLAGTYIAPENSLRCGLDDRWQNLFSTHNGKAVRRIQDAFECCGLHSTIDRAYPFPAKDIGVDACKKGFGRTISCFESWKEEEKRIAGLMLLVVLLVALWKVNMSHLGLPSLYIC